MNADQWQHAVSVNGFDSWVFVLYGLAAWSTLIYIAGRVGAFSRKKNMPSQAQTGRLIGLLNRPVMRYRLLLLAYLPGMSYVANLVPWWRCGPLPTRFATYLACWAALSLGVTWLTNRLWARHSPSQIAGLVAGITATIIVVDGLCGSVFGWGAPFGIRPIDGSRLHGYGNVEVAFLIATLLAG
ncbi:MAG: hypothetical protein LBG70_02535, partial [Bifidobacteriaceae bacterium]|nr:hypothetical protein [Bifidobacteriaceae bacterium]